MRGLQESAAAFRQEARMSRARRSVPAIAASIMAVLLSLAATVVAIAGEGPGPLPK